jgi:hypothetical protein
MLSVGVSQQAKESPTRDPQGVQTFLQRRSRRVAEVGEDRLAAGIPELALGRRDRVACGGGEEGFDRTHEPGRGLIRQRGARRREGQESGGENDTAREARRRTPAPLAHVGQYAAIPPPIVRSSRGFGVSSHSRFLRRRRRRPALRMTNTPMRVTKGRRARRSSPLEDASRSARNRAIAPSRNFGRILSYTG